MTPEHQAQRAVAPDVQASRVMGDVLSAVLLVLVAVQLVRGEDASPYAQLLLLAGVVWGVTLLWARARARRPRA